MGSKGYIHYTVFVMVYKTGYSRQHSTIHVQFSAEPPRGGGSMPRWFAVLIRGGSNEYPQSMFWSKNKKNKVYPYIWNISYALVRNDGRSVCFFKVFVRYKRQLYSLGH